MNIKRNGTATQIKDEELVLDTLYDLAAQCKQLNNLGQLLTVCRAIAYSKMYLDWLSRPEEVM